MVFVVGFESNATTRVKLLSQINEFFNSYSNNLEEDLNVPTHDSELEDLSIRVQEALETADTASKRLQEINQEMVRYVVAMGGGKAASKSKKKLEKALMQAKEDIMSLTDKLLGAQTEIEDKEDQMTKLYRQIDMKTLEIERFKHAAELAKKNLSEVDVLKEQLEEKENEIQQLNRQISDLQLSLQQIEHTREHTIAKLKATNEQQELAINKLENKLSGSQVVLEDTRRDLQKQHELEIDKLNKEHDEEVQRITQEYTDKIDQMEESAVNRVRNWASDSEDDQESLGMSRQSTSLSKRRGSSKLNQADSSIQSSSIKKVALNSSTPSTPKEGSSKSLSIKDLEGSKSSTPKRSIRTKSNLEPVHEVPFEEKFALEDEQKWAQVPPEQLPSAFKHYRGESLMVIRGLSNELKLVKDDHHNRVKALRSQMIDRQQKWDSERQVLTVQVEQAQRLQHEAEKEADGAMAQLEDIINEQAKLVEHAEKAEAGEVTMSVKVPPTSTMVQTDDNYIADADHKVAISNNVSGDNESIPQLNSRELTAVESIPVSNLATGNASEFGSERPFSAASQRSMYEKYKSEMEQRKAEIVERRSKATSMHGSLLSTKNSRPTTSTTTLSNAGVPFSVNGEEGELTKVDMATSPYAFSTSSKHSKLSSAAKENPIISHYLKTYDFINEFKETLTQLFADKEIMSASEQLSDLKMISFSEEKSIQNQIQEMTSYSHQFLKEAAYIINTVFHSGYEPAVSSLLSRGDTRKSILLKSKSASMDTEKSSINMEREPSMVTTGGDDQFQQLLLMNEQLKKDNQQQKEEYEEKLNHNTVVMMEMQDMIQDLQRELAALNASSKAMSSRASMYEVDQTIIFSRLDFERNQKSLKRAVKSDRITPEKYNEVVHTMDEYVKIPKQRLAHLVKKYTHHTNMKAIEENVRKSGQLDDEVFRLLERMEALQSKRAQRWGEDMDKMAEQRLMLANLLMETLSLIEEESGIFMIKPILSWKGRGWVPSYPRRPTSRSNQERSSVNRTITPARNSTPFNVAPAPTPASFHTLMKSARPHSQASEMDNRLQGDFGVPESNKNVSVKGETVSLVGDSVQPMWAMSSSVPRPVGDSSSNLSLIHTPKILELDVNRLLIGQNTFSAATKALMMSNDRLTNAANGSVRSYVSVPRLAKSQSGELRHSRPNSTGASSERKKVAIPEPKSVTPPATPTFNASTRISNSRLSPVQPLPPIKVPSDAERQKAITEEIEDELKRPTTTESNQAHSKVITYPSPPESPPGSSVPHSVSQSPYSVCDIIEEPRAPTPGHVTRVTTRSVSQSTTRSITPEGLTVKS
ncbi:golgin subfamily A member 4-like isoform X2 [Anneissia japonica]|uniref:golgin subfamily A member 4-like isoform X2 n=1 Tax=Anneissia japonica TaxID=1529436 RepID=UPI0014258229|nr:golgin subfamily A member 4-like isoform X2 [Anneissia japonica]